MNINRNVWLPPLTHHEFYALLALRSDSYRVYGLRDRIIMLSQGCLAPSHTAIKQLAERLTERRWLQKDHLNRYSITIEGHERLLAECRRLRFAMRFLIQ